MKVFGYIRVSSKMQLEGDGPDRQAAAINEFCKTQGIQLSGLHQEAITGTREGLDRPVLSELLAHSGCTLVVEKMDRLARDLIVSELLLRECRKRNIKVYSTDQGPIDIAGHDIQGDPARTFFRQIMAATAEFEKSMLVAKLTAAKRRIEARTGERCGGSRPYGQNKRDPQESRIKTLALDFVKAGNSFSEVARLLNEAGFQTRQKQSWSKQSVYRITL